MAEIVRGDIMSLHLKAVKKSLPEYKKIKKLYHDAFPLDERAPFWLLMRRANRENVDFWAVYHEEEWVGLVYVISREDLSYLFYLAIAEDVRGKGYGSAVLAAVKEKYAGRRIMLAIEELDERAENYAERIRRKQFYEKNGLHLMDYKMREAKVIYDVMGIADTVSPEEYGEMMKQYLGRLLGHFISVELMAK